MVRISIDYDLANVVFEECVRMYSHEVIAFGAMAARAKDREYVPSTSPISYSDTSDLQCPPPILNSLPSQRTGRYRQTRIDSLHLRRYALFMLISIQ